jgi:hypothetical protein
MRKRFGSIVLGAAALLGAAGSAQAQFLPMATFEGPDLSGTPDGGEGLGTNNGGAIGTFGATEGTSSLFFDNKAAGNQVLFDFGTMNGDPVPPNDPERRNNYLVVAAASQAADPDPGGPPAPPQDVFLQFDVTYDASATTTRGFIQLGVSINSEAGFDALWFGGLLNGDLGNPPFGPADFPQLDPAAAAGGVTMTALDPSNFSTGDFVGAVRVSIPVGPSKILLLGTGGDPGFDFAQLGFNMNSGYGGALDLAYDNIGFQIGAVPEPASAGLLASAGLGLLAGRRRRRLSI